MSPRATDPPRPATSDPDHLVEDVYVRDLKWWEFWKAVKPGRGWPSDGPRPDVREPLHPGLGGSGIASPLRLGTPDRETQERMAEFLVDRHRPAPAPRKGVVRVTETDKVVTWDGRWAYLGGTPKNHLMAAVTVFVLANGIANGLPLYGAFRQVWDHFFGKDRVEQVDLADTVFEVQGNAVSETVPDAEIIALAADEIEAALGRGAEVTGITIDGIASDEYSQYGDASLQRVDVENIALANERARLDAIALQNELVARGIPAIPIEVLASERVLTPEQFAQLDALRTRFGYDSILAAELAHRDRPGDTPPELAAALDAFELGRGARITIESTDNKTQVIPRPPVDREPFRFIPAIIPPIPLVRRRVTKTPRVFEIPASEDFLEFVKLYPQALRQDLTLVQNAWMYSRTYQNLLREEGRIRRVAQLDYVDGTGTPQRLRAIFVDHEPSAAELAMVEDSLRTLSLARDGSIAEDLDLIAIFPSQNAGRHGRPKDIGLGIDIQYDEGVLGVAIPCLGLVEMHLDPNATAEELWASGGPRHTLIHETLGHFTDLRGGPTRLIPVREITTIEAYRARVPWAGVATDDWIDLTVNPEHQHYVIRRTSMTDGEPHVVDEVVLGGDPRLARADEIAKSGFPTRYAETSPLEHYADSVAAALDGIALEDAANTGPAPLTPEPGYADRFGPAPRTRGIIVDRLGADPTVTDTLAFTSAVHDRIRSSWQFDSGSLEQFPELAGAAFDARYTPMPENLIGIVVPVRFNDASRGGPDLGR